MRASRGLAGLIGLGLACGAPQPGAPAPEDASPRAEADAIAFVGVRVFDGERVLEDATVLVEGETIVAVGRNVDVPAGTLRVEGAGRTLLPGLIDAHTHVWEASHLETALAFGVTTNLDQMTPPMAVSALRAEEDSRAGYARADLHSAGFAATVPGGHGTEYGFLVPTLSRPEEAAAFVAERVAEGSEWIKIIHDDATLYGAPQPAPTLDEATMRALVEAAHAAGRMAVVHPGGLSGARAAVRAGADALVHVWGDSVPEAAFIERIHADSMFVVPTLGVQASVGGTPGGLEISSDARLLPFLDADARDNLARAFPRMPTSRASYEAAARSAALLREAGVPVLAGSDAPNPGTWYGVSLHDELERLVRDAGFTPLEALRAATAAPAAAFGLRDRGRVAAGLRADLLLVDGDPTRDITATRAIVGVWKRGRALDRDAFRASVARRVAALEAANGAVEVSAGGITLSDFSDDSPSSSMGRWVVSTDQLAGGTSTGAMHVVDGALVVTGVVAAGLPYAWSGAMLFPGAQPMEPVDLSNASGVALRVRGPASLQLALFTQRDGRVPAAIRFDASGEWQDFTFSWSDFGAHDGADVLGIAVIAGPEPGAFEFALDDVRLVP